jgi:hypothetical protein
MDVKYKYSLYLLIEGQTYKLNNASSSSFLIRSSFFLPFLMDKYKHVHVSYKTLKIILQQKRI